MTTTTVGGRRELQLFQGDDYIMIPDLDATDSPSRITLCTDQTNLLTGFQVFYGIYNEKAGSAHGNIATNCANHLINAPIVEVQLYGSGSGTPYLEGIVIKLQNYYDGTYPGISITAGKVNNAGQKLRSVRLPNNSGSGAAVFEFFGFKTTSSAK